MAQAVNLKKRIAEIEEMLKEMVRVEIVIRDYDNKEIIKVLSTEEDPTHRIVIDI